jgi:putative transposase
VCAVLTDFGMRIAPSTYYAAISRPPSTRAVRDVQLKKDITRVYENNYSVYGAEKVWWALNREGIVVGRGRVERLMRALGLTGAVRGKKVRTTVADPDGVHAADVVKRQFTAGAPNRLWVADFTYVATWAGTVYTAFTIDVFSPENRRLENEHVQGDRPGPGHHRDGDQRESLPGTRQGKHARPPFRCW